MQAAFEIDFTTRTEETQSHRLRLGFFFRCPRKESFPSRYGGSILGGSGPGGSILGPFQLGRAVERELPAPGKELRVLHRRYEARLIFRKANVNVSLEKSVSHFSQPALSRKTIAVDVPSSTRHDFRMLFLRRAFRDQPVQLLAFQGLLAHQLFRDSNQRSAIL